MVAVDRCGRRVRCPVRVSAVVGDILASVDATWPSALAYDGDVNGVVHGSIDDEVDEIVICRQGRASDLVPEGRRRLLLTHEPIMLASHPPCAMITDLDLRFRTDLHLLRLLTSNPITVAYVHSALDTGPSGAAAIMAREVGLGPVRSTTNPFLYVVDVEPGRSVAGIATHLAGVYDVDAVRIFDVAAGPVDRLAVVPGAALGMVSMLDDAVAAGASLIVSGGLSEARLACMECLGLSAVEIDGQRNELTVLGRIRDLLCSQFDVDVVMKQHLGSHTVTRIGAR